MRLLFLALASSALLGWHLASPRLVETSGDPLAPFEPFVGREWVATFPDGKLTDAQRFGWMFGKKFVRNSHEVRDAEGKLVYEGETIYGWDAADEELRWWYFNATGGWIDGTVTAEADGSLVFDGQNHAGPEQPAKVRSSSRFDGPERWTSTTWFWRDGEWRVERELEFRPKR